MYQGSLFEHVPELGQFFTPKWLADKIAKRALDVWKNEAPRSRHGTFTRGNIVEPACGNGALVRAMLDVGIPADCIIANDIDPRWAKHCAERFPGVTVTCANFLFDLKLPTGVSVVVMNPPFGKDCSAGNDVDFLEHALKVAPNVISVIRAELEHQVDADSRVFSKTNVRWRARCIGRPDFGGDYGASFETSVVQLAAWAGMAVEERWRKPSSNR